MRQKMRMRSLLLFGTTCLVLNGCWANNRSTPHVKQETPSTSNNSTLNSGNNDKTIAAATLGNISQENLYELTFTKDNYTLDDEAINILNSIVNKLKKMDAYHDVIVMGWSDREYPSKNMKHLSAADIALADKRNNVVKSYLASQHSIVIDVYNMAEKPSLISRWLNNSENRLKKSLLAVGLPTTADAPQFNSKASNVIVFLKTI